MGNNVEQQLIIMRQSTLKSSTEIAQLIGYKPKSLREFLHFNEIIVDYCAAGEDKAVIDEIKKFDNHLKTQKDGLGKR